MGAIDKISNYFYTDLEKKNIRMLMEAIFPDDGEVVNHGKIEGEKGLHWWTIKPEVWWDVVCKKTDEMYHLHFKYVETAAGDIYYFWNGEHYYNFAFVAKENELRRRINEFIQSGNLELLTQWRE